MLTVLRALMVLSLSVCLDAAEFGRISFPMTTTVKENETVTVQVAYPLRTDGKPTAEAADMVYYAPFWSEETFANGGVFLKLAEHFTVVGIFLDDRTLPDSAIPSRDPASGSFAAITAAVEEARKRLGLPPGKVFGCGHSSGGSLIYYATRAHPDYFEAIAPIAGTAPPITSTIQVPTLHVLTFGDEDRIPSDLSWHALQSQGEWSSMLTPDPWWATRDVPIWLHLNSQESIDLTVAWLRAVADLRAAHGGKLPAPRDWPVQVDAKLVAATAEPDPSGMRAFPNADLVRRFRAAHRHVEHLDDLAHGLRIARVTPLAGADRTVVVLIDPSRRPDMALYDAVLVAGKGGDALAVQAADAHPDRDVLLALITAEQRRHPERHCFVIAEAVMSGALDGLPRSITRVVIDPKSAVAPGTTVVAVADTSVPADAVTVKGPFSSAEVRRQSLLMAACDVVAHR